MYINLCHTHSAADKNAHYKSFKIVPIQAPSWLDLFSLQLDCIVRGVQKKDNQGEGKGPRELL